VDVKLDPGDFPQIAIFSFEAVLICLLSLML